MCLFLSELGDAPQSIDGTSFEAIKPLAVRSCGLLWETSSSFKICAFPELAIRKGSWAHVVLNTQTGS